MSVWILLGVYERLGWVVVVVGVWVVRGAVGGVGGLIMVWVLFIDLVTVAVDGVGLIIGLVVVVGWVVGVVVVLGVGFMIGVWIMVDWVVGIAVIIGVGAFDGGVFMVGGNEFLIRVGMVIGVMVRLGVRLLLVGLVVAFIESLVVDGLLEVEFCTRLIIVFMSRVLSIRVIIRLFSG